VWALQGGPEASTRVRGFSPQPGPSGGEPARPGRTLRRTRDVMRFFDLLFGFLIDLDAAFMRALAGRRSN
jgi:hypothetical protein